MTIKSDEMVNFYVDRHQEEELEKRFNVHQAHPLL